MQKDAIIFIESKLSILIDSIETIKRLELLTDLIPSFETDYTKQKRLKYFNELLIYLIKSEILIELAYEYTINKTHENEILLKMLDDKYRTYLSKIIFLAHLYDCLVKKSLANSQLINNVSTFFHE